MRILFIILISFLLFSCAQKQQVDFIITNAEIYTSDDSLPKAQSIAVDKGKFVCVGTNEEILSAFNSDNIKDFSGKFIYPGLIDAHCHFIGYAKSLQYADLKKAASFQDVLEIISEHRKKYPSEWLVGRGWDQNKWSEKVFPDNAELNKIFPDIPVVLIRIDGHAALANQKALSITGINSSTKIQGGEIQKKNGNITGILLDKACDHIRSYIPNPTNTGMALLLKEAEKQCFAVGLTMLADAGLDASEIHLIDSLQKSGALKMKIYAMLNPTKENYTKYMDKGIYATPLLKIASVKLYADGALGSRGALLLAPYSDDIKNSGILVESTEALRETMQRADKAGYQVCTHAIGDSAVRLILKLYGEILKEKNDKRWRIEHSQVVHSNDIHKYGTFSIIPAVNTTHATSDMGWAENRLGAERIHTAYAYQNLLIQNNWLSNGSDFPIESINPIYGFHAAIARKDHEGNPENGFLPDNALTREQALKAMTVWAARACFMENEIGSIKKGMAADFVIFDRDIMKEAEKNVWQFQPLETFINGQNVMKK